MSYKRLTTRKNNVIDTNCTNCKRYKKYSCYDEDACYVEIINSLAELEDRIENGTLVELPPPSNKFAIVEYYGQKNKPLKIVEYKLFAYNLTSKKVEKLWYCANTRFSIIMENIATKPEAEAKLKQIRKEN